MGDDYESKLIVGFSIDIETIRKNQQQKYEETEEEYELREMADNLEKLPFNKEFPHVSLISTSPYFDCPANDTWWYIRVNDSECIDMEDIKNISAHFDELQQFIEKYQIPDAKISVFSTHDVW